MKRNLISLLLSILIFLGTTGCSVVRFAENRTGYGVKQTAVVDTDTRQTQLSRRDLQLGFTATDSGFSLQLQYLPYYHMEQREIVKTRARITGLDTALGLASAGVLGWIVYDNWANRTSANTYTISKDGNFIENSVPYWEAAAPWEKAVVIGVSADFLLTALQYTTTQKMTTPWQRKGEVEGTLQGLENHPYRIELLDHGLEKDYQTTSGDESIVIREFLAGIKKPASFLEVDKLELRASTEFEGKPYAETLTLTDAVRLKPFHDFARAAALKNNTVASRTSRPTQRSETTPDTTEKKVMPDTTPPTIALGPIPTVNAETQRVTIQGSVTSEIGIQGNRILIDNNGKTLPSATLTANDKFAMVISLSEGENRITLAAVDKNRKRTEKSLTMHRPAMPPQIEILEPRLDANNAADVRQPTQQIKVRITDASDIERVTLNGKKMEATVTKNVYVLTSTPILARGIFTVSAVDIHGSESSKGFTLTYEKPDETPPVITILEPSRDANNAATIAGESFRVTVQVIDESGIAEVKINGEQAAASGNDRFSRQVRYVSNLKKVEISATDTKGNSDTANFKVVLQPKPEPPLVNERTPAETDLTPKATRERVDPRLLFADSKLENERHQTTNKETFGLEFIVIDDSRIKEVVVTRRSDDITYQVSKLGKRDYEAQLQLNEGENKFEIRVTDEWENHELKTFTITRIQTDTKAPTFTSLAVGEGVWVQQIPVRGGYLASNELIVVTNETTTIRGMLSDDSGIASVSLTVNDNTTEAVVLQDSNRFEKGLSLDYGQNRITITAADTRGNTDTTEFTLHQRPNRDGKDFALFFTTDEYLGKKDSTGQWKNLTTPIADAEEVAKELRNNYGFKTRIFKNLTGRELMDILTEYQDKFIDETGREFLYKAASSQLLIYFAGHGYYHKKTDTGYLITRESEPPELDPSQYTAIDHERLRKQIDLIKCDRILVLMDTCFSGTFDPKYKPQTSVQVRSLVDNGTLLQQIKMMLRLTARWCLTSASSEYVADRGQGGHSPFAAAFLEALNTRGGRDNLLKLDEIWEKIYESRNADIYEQIAAEFERLTGEKFELPEPRKGQFGSKPELYEESDFLLFPIMID